MGVYFRVALRNLAQARRRTLLLSAALALVTLLLVLLSSLSQGMTETMVRSATTLAAGHVNVAGWYKATAYESQALVTNAPAVRRVVEENTPGLDYVIERQRGWARVIGPLGSVQSGITGIDPAREERFFENLQVVDGDVRDLAQRDTALIFQAQAERLGARAGDVLTFTTESLSGQRNTADVRVAAVAKDLGFMSGWSVIVPAQVVLELYALREDTAGSIQVYLKDIDDAPRVMAHLREVLAAHGHDVMDHDPEPFWMKFERIAGEDWKGQKLDLTTWDDEVSFLKWVITGLDTLSLILVGVLVAIIAVGIMNTMWIAVRERTQEIGTLRAIGMSRRRVLGMFLLEAALLGFFGTAAGALLGAAVVGAVEAARLHVPWPALQAVLMSDTLHLVLRPGGLAATVAAFTGVTTLAALWPSLRAARLQPVTAIHHVG